MAETSLLPGEQPLREFRPHPLSFLGDYLSSVVPAIWAVAFAWFVNSSLWDKVPWDKADFGFLPLAPETAAAYVVFLGGLATLGSWVATVRIRWSLFFLFVGAGLLGIALSWPTKDYAVRAPQVLIVAAVPILLISELNRRRHHYLLTNTRIIIRGGAFSTKERQIRYESITDIDATQGPLGRAFGFGTIIPITQSGFGLGADSSQASLSAGGGGRRGFLAISAGGGRQVQSGRARSFHQLTGARPFKEIKRILEEQLHAGSQASLLQSQLELQRQTLAALRNAAAQPPASPAPPRLNAPAWMHDVDARGKSTTITRHPVPVTTRAAPVHSPSPPAPPAPRQPAPPSPAAPAATAPRPAKSAARPSPPAAPASPAARPAPPAPQAAVQAGKGQPPRRP